MPGEVPNGVTAPSESGPKKELSNEQLKAYIQKARSKIKKLEQENKSLLEQVQQADENSAAETSDRGLVSSLKDEVELWKANYQQQLEAAATAPAPNEDGEQRDSGSLSQALQNLAKAQEEASRWEEKAVALQGLEASVHSLEEELQQSRISEELARQSLIAQHHEESLQQKTTIEALRLDNLAGEEATRNAQQTHEKASAELQAQVENLLQSAGVLEHRLVNAQQERDQAVATSSELEQEIGRIGADARGAAEERCAAAESLAAERETRQQELEQALAQALAESAELRSKAETVRLAGEEEERELVAEATRAREEAVASLSEARAEVALLEERRDGVEEELARVRRERDEAAEVTGGLKGELEALRAEVDEERERTAGLEKGRDEAARDKEEAEKRAATAEKSGDESARSMAALREELEAEREASSAHLAEAEAVRAGAEQEAGEIRRRVEDLDKQVDELQERLAEASTVLEAKETEVSPPDSGATQNESETAATAEAPPEETPSAKATMQSRCEQLELEASAAAEKIAALEQKLSDSVAAASAASESKALRGSSIEEDGSDQTPAVAPMAPQATVEDEEGGEPATSGVISGSNEQSGEGVGGALAGETNRVALEMLETKLQAAQTLAKESQETVKEMEGVVAAMKKEEAALHARLLELAAETAEAKEAASLAQEGLEAEKEGFRAMTDRVGAAEALALELKEQAEAAGKAAEDFGETSNTEKAALNARVLELTAETAAAREAAILAQEGLETEKAGLTAMSDRVNTAESLVRELEEQKELAARAAEDVTERFSAEKAALNAHLLELEATTAAAKEAAPLAQRGLEAEKERLRAMSDRATAAEALVLELERKGEVAAKAAQNTAETFSEEKAALEARLQEAAEDAARSQQALAAAVADSASAEEAAAAAARTERERSELESQVAAQKTKLQKAIARLRSLKAEKEAAAEGLASQSALLEVSQKNLKDAEVRCHSLEEAVGEERAAAVTARKDAADKLSELEAEVSGLRQELATVTQHLSKADDRARGAFEEATSLRDGLQERHARVEEAQEALRAAEANTGRIPALEAELEAERAGRRGLEDAVEDLRGKVTEMGSSKEVSAKESEEIMVALQGQVDAANQERDAAGASLEAAEKDKESSRSKLGEVVAKYKNLKAKLNAAEEESADLKAEAEKAAALEEKRVELESKVEELASKLTEAGAALKERDGDFVKTVADNKQAAAAEKAARTELEGKVKRLKSLLSKLQKSSQSKDADIAALKAPPPPKAFTVDLRVRHLGSVWCLVQPRPSMNAEAGEGVTSPEGSSEEGNTKQWVNEDKARVWIAGGSSTSDETLWPIVVQDTFEEKVAAAAAEASVAVAKVNSTQAELDKLASDFSKYKARAHTALKKATSSGADEKRKDEVIAGLVSERDRLSAELRETTATLEVQLADVRKVLKGREDDLETASEQLENAQEEMRELERTLRDQERKIVQLQEAEDGHSEELSTLRAARDELKSQLKATKALADESSCIVQRLQEELETLAKERESSDGRGSDSWNMRSDGGWAGQQMLATKHGLPTSGESALGFADKLRLAEGSSPSSPMGVSGTEALPSVNTDDAGGDRRDGNSLTPTGKGGARKPVHLMAVAELERRHASMETQIQAEVSEMRTELAEALLRVEQLSEQEAVLKATVRALEIDLKTERDLGTGEAAPVNVAYLKSAVVRYMSTRDAGEQRSLLRVITAMLQLTREEVVAVETRITELEKTMVGRAGSMVGGAGRRVGGVVGGVVGLVWRGGGRGAAAAGEEDEDGGYVSEGGQG